MELSKLINERYEYRDGGLYIKTQYNSMAKIGKRAGNYTADGYRHMRVNGKVYREHQLVWFLHKGYLPKEIDHINCVRDDNRIENLRECTRTENMQNRKNPMSTNKLGLLGVTKHYNKFRAQITRNGKQKHIGLFDTAEEAHRAYLNAPTE
jgi:hypothetical protein